MSKKRASRNKNKVLKSLKQKRKNYRRGGAYRNFEEELVGMGGIPGGKFTNVKATLPKPENSVKGNAGTSGQASDYAMSTGSTNTTYCNSYF